ncbi:MAG TPA: hypothetical protein VFH17_06595 [Coriobacteriia bacterium]|nr:hypothetical protein [Coriobacteriia bacterium]
MVFGYVPSVMVLTLLGIVAFAGLVFQILVGKRTIRFKGRTHMKVHRRTGYVITVIAGVHGFLALVRVNQWVIGW